MSSERYPACIRHLHWMVAAGAWYVRVGSVWGVVILVVLHVAAALWHPFVLRDRWISRRML